MVSGANLFFSLFNNLAIFIALVAVYGYVIIRLGHAGSFRRQVSLGLSFGVFAIGCMYAKIPVFEGVVVDQRNAVIALSGVFGGPVAAFLSALLASLFRVYLGGNGVLAGVVGITLAATAGSVIHYWRGPFDSLGKAARNALLATVVILPGFMLVGDFQTGLTLLKAMTIPYGSAIFLGIWLVGLVLRREEVRFETELAFRESEKKYRSVVEGTQDLITSTDEEGRFVFVNHMAAEILGLAPEACIGKSAFQFVHPEDRERTANWFRAQVARKVTQARIENRQVSAASGRVHTVLWSVAFQYGPDGALREVGGIARDVTEVREAEESFRNLFEKMPDAYVLYQIIRDKAGQPVDYRHVSLNPAFETITGIPADTFVGKTLTEVYPEAEGHWQEAFREVALQGTPRNVEAYSGLLGLYLKTMIYRPAEDKLAVIFEDMTPRIKAEEDKKAIEAHLRQTQKLEAIGTLSGGIAHDFNNLLSTIMGYSELVQGSLPAESLVTHEMDEVLKATHRAKELVRRIMTFSRNSEQGRVSVDLAALVTEVTNFLRATIPTTIRIELDLQPGCGSILADPTQIHQVLMNLGTNAAHAMEGEVGVLKIELRPELLTAQTTAEGADQKPGPYVLLAVSDSGHGIAPEHLDRIFEPYFTTKTVGKGSGLGLSVVHGIVKSHQGFIQAESTVGQGTVFRLYFPRIEAAAAAQEADTDSVPGGQERILVVDDDPGVAEVTLRHLQRLGYQVTAVTSSLQTLEIFRADPRAFDLIITDQTMPDMVGSRLVAEALAIRPDIPVILCTGYRPTAGEDTESVPGVSAMLLKPFNSRKLASTVRRVLDSGQIPA